MHQYRSNDIIQQMSIYYVEGQPLSEREAKRHQRKHIYNNYGSFTSPEMEESALDDSEVHSPYRNAIGNLCVDQTILPPDKPVETEQELLLRIIENSGGTRKAIMELSKLAAQGAMIDTGDKQIEAGILSAVMLNLNQAAKHHKGKSLDAVLLTDGLESLIQSIPETEQADMYREIINEGKNNNPLWKKFG